MSLVYGFGGLRDYDGQLSVKALRRAAPAPGGASQTPLQRPVGRDRAQRIGQVRIGQVRQRPRVGQVTVRRAMGGNHWETAGG